MSLKTWARNESGQAVQQNCLENLTKSAKLPGGVGAGGTLKFSKYWTIDNLNSLINSEARRLMGGYWAAAPLWSRPQWKCPGGYYPRGTEFATTQYRSVSFHREFKSQLGD